MVDFEDKIYPIRKVAEETGILPITLRAWERRYGLIKPGRTHKSHRLYSQADIEQVKKILGLMGQGIPVSQVKFHLGQTNVVSEQTDPISINKLYDKLLQAICEFNEQRFGSLFDDLSQLYPHEIIFNQVILPLINNVELSDVQKLIAVEYLERKLITIFHRNFKIPCKKNVLIAVSQSNVITSIHQYLLANSLYNAELKCHVIVNTIDRSTLIRAAAYHDASGVLLYIANDKKSIEIISVISDIIERPVLGIVNNFSIDGNDMLFKYDLSIRSIRKMKSLIES